MKIRILAVAGLALLFGKPSFAQQAATCDGPQDACQQIIKGLKQFEAAYNRKDVAGVGAVFTPDAVIVWEGPMLSGREAIEKFYGDGFKAGFADNSSPADQVHVMGNMAWLVGSWSASGPGPNNTTQTYQGNWGSVNVNEGGTWKTRMLTWNTIENLPEQAGASASTNRK
jgi:uncharacterized protein (TIGR02246 family)